MTESELKNHLGNALHLVCDLLQRIQTRQSYTVPEDFRILEEIVKESNVRPSNFPSQNDLDRGLGR